MPKYKIAKLSDQVYEVQDFITKEELDQVRQFIKLRSSTDWDCETQYEFWSGKTLKPNLLIEDNVFSLIKQRAKTLFSGDFDLTGITLQRYMIDDALGQHADDHEGHRINGEKVFCGIVIYYNDDYEGGEVKYPDLGIIHKPIAGSLLLHGGQIIHGTLPVKDNIVRYISTMFVRHKLDEVVHLNKEVFGEVDEI